MVQKRLLKLAPILFSSDRNTQSAINKFLSLRKTLFDYKSYSRTFLFLYVYLPVEVDNTLYYCNKRD